ncbi:hypothetical protein ACLESD_44835, partial [Pyxidicoccus sp. 3LFB2]
AVEAEHARPLFLQAGPVRVARVDGDALGPLQEGLFRVVDAGFTLVSLDLSRLDSYAAVEALNVLAGPVSERELSLELTAPASSGGDPLDAYRTLLEGLRQWKVPVRFVRVGEGVLGAGEPDVDLVRRLVDLASDYDAVVTVGEVGTGVPARCHLRGGGGAQGGLRGRLRGASRWAPGRRRSAPAWRRRRWPRGCPPASCSASWRSSCPR